MFNVQCSMLNVQCSISNAQCSMLKILNQYSIRNVQCSKSGSSRESVFATAGIFLFSIPIPGRSRAGGKFQRMGIVVFLQASAAPSARGECSSAPYPATGKNQVKALLRSKKRTQPNTKWHFLSGIKCVSYWSVICCIFFIANTFLFVFDFRHILFICNRLMCSPEKTSRKEAMFLYCFIVLKKTTTNCFFNHKTHCREERKILP